MGMGKREGKEDGRGDGMVRVNDYKEACIDGEGDIRANKIPEE